MKPRKSGRVTKTPQPKLVPQKSSRRTPQLTKAPAGPTVRHARGLPLKPLPDIDGEVGALDFGLEKDSGDGATTKKRKATGDSDERQILKKPRTEMKVKNSAVSSLKRGRQANARSTANAGLSHEPKITDEFERTMDHGLNLLSIPESKPIEAMKEGGALEHAVEAPGSVAVNPRTENLEHTDEAETEKLGKRKATTTTEKVSDSIKAVIESQTSATAAPVKKRKKRRSIGQQSTRTKKRPSIEDTVNPSPPSDDAGKIDVNNEPPEPKERTAEPEMDLKRLRDFEVHQEALDLNQAGGDVIAPTIQAKSKPRKKRKAIAQTSRPRKTLKKDKIAEALRTISVPRETDSTVIVDLPYAKITKSTGRPRKPLANVTNLSKSMKPKIANMNPKEKLTLAKDLLETHHPIELKSGIEHPDQLPIAGLSQVSSSVEIKKPREAKAKSTLTSKSTRVNPSETAVKNPALPRKQDSELENGNADATKAASPLPEPTLSQPRANTLESTRPTPSIKKDQLAPPQPTTKKRGRPRKTPVPNLKAIANSPKHSRKEVKIPPTRRKQPANSIPITIYRPISSHEAAYDSDDPLSLDVPYPPKKAPNAVDVLSQVSLEILEKYSNRAGVSVDEKEVVELYSKELKEQLKEMTGMVDRNAALREKVMEVEKEEKTLKKKLKAVQKEECRERVGKLRKH